MQTLVNDWTFAATGVSLMYQTVSKLNRGSVYVSFQTAAARSYISALIESPALSVKNFGPGPGSIRAAIERPENGERLKSSSCFR